MLLTNEGARSHSVAMCFRQQKQHQQQKDQN